MAPATRRARHWSLVAMESASVLALLLSRSDAARPGREGVSLSRSGSIIIDDGSTFENYELRESDPAMAQFVSIGSAAQKLLNKSGYAYGSLVRIAHSDMDKEYGEGPQRTAWFPMAVFVDVFEEGSGDNGEDVTERYELALDYLPKTITPPGLVILEARKLNADGSVAATLSILPPEEMGFIGKNQSGLAMMFGVIIASGVVKFLRKGIERLLKARKERKESKEGAASAAAATATKPSVVARGKATKATKATDKKKSGAAKQD